MDDLVRCGWCTGNELDRIYHDEEWGVPVHEDRKHFEYLSMEVMQCGLSWNLMLKKRETFRMCFDNFDFDKIASYKTDDVRRIMAVPNMIHSQRKIEAVINNARKFLEIIEEWGSFDSYLWKFSDNKMLVYESHRADNWVARNELSDIISKDMKKRGFKYLGSITVYSHLQACGIINDHARDCFFYGERLKQAQVRYISEDVL